MDWARTPPEDEARIREWIETKCDSPVGVEIETVDFGDAKVRVVRVPQGRNPPYTHRDNGVIYVRRGSTDRPARRSEIDKFYAARQAVGGRSPLFRGF